MNYVVTVEPMTIEKTNFNSLSDEELLILVTQNSREALIALFDRYSEDLYVYIMQIACARTRGEQLQEDTKEILIRVFDSFWTARAILPKTLHLNDYLFSSAYQH